MNELPVKIRVEIINEKVESLRKDFEEFIKDKSRPLAERWIVFSSANDALSENLTYLPDFKFLDKEKFDWRDQYFVEGRGVSNTIELVNNLVEFRALDNYFKEAEEYYEPLMEEILERNIKQIAFNW